MECKPFNIKVMLVAPGSIKSNISNNQAATFSLPADSLYTGYLHKIMERLYSSQGKHSLPTDVFARSVVSKALRKEPPSYLTVGARTVIFAILKWLPRALVLNLMWRTHT